MKQTKIPIYEMPTPKIAIQNQFEVLQNLSTENLIIWITGNAI